MGDKTPGLVGELRGEPGRSAVAGQGCGARDEPLIRGVCTGAPREENQRR